MPPLPDLPKKIWVVWLTIVIFMSTSCSNQENSTVSNFDTLPIHIDLANNLNKEKELFLSDLADSISYVPLETHEDCFVQQGSSVIHINQGFLIIPPQNPILYFDNNGKFVRKIGRIGKGPGEFRYVWGCFFSEKDNRIYLYGGPGHPVIIYDLNGTFIRSFNSQELASYFHLFANGNSVFIADYAIDNPLAQTFYCANSRGELTQTTNKVVYKTHHFGEDFRLGYHLFQNDAAHILLPHYYCDTVYQMAEDYSITPFCVLNLGQDEIPQYILDNPASYRDHSDNYFTNIRVRVFASRILVGFWYNQIKRVGCFDRCTGDFFNVNNLDTLMPSIRNDLDGGPSFRDDQYSTYDKSAQLYQPIDLLDYRRKGYFSESNAKNREDYARFMQLVDRLDENANPIVMITYMKKK